MPKHNPLQKWAAALTLVLFSAGTFALADTVTLKNGSKIEGKVLSENDKEVVIEERVAAGITDTRTVPKAEVAKIEKVAQDAPAYQALKNLQPGANSLPAANYDQVIRSLNNFINSYPQSTHVADVKKQLAAWEEEKTRVDAGEVKLANRWLSKEEADKEKYQISGQLLLNYMQQQQRQGDLTGAMNSFDQLEKNFPNSRAYIDAVELARTILPTLKANADRSSQQWKFQQAEREKGLQLLSEAQRAETMAAIKRDEQKAEAAVEAANKSGLKWPPLVPNERGLMQIQALANDEPRRLAEVPVAKMRQSLELTEKARVALNDKKVDEADELVKQAINLWNTNEVATRLQTDVGNLRNAIASAPPPPTPEEKAAAEAAALVAASPTPTAAAAPAAEEPAAPSEAATEDEPPFFKTPFGVVTILVVIIIVAGIYSALRKIAKRSREVIE
jgi:outer membrane protein assembly factor BamD (BamD/ComL family)